MEAEGATKTYRVPMVATTADMANQPTDQQRRNLFVAMAENAGVSGAMYALDCGHDPAEPCRIVIEYVIVP